jgi:hypothetical protein
LGTLRYYFNTARRLPVFVAGTGVEHFVEGFPLYVTDNQGRPVEATIHWTQDGFIIESQQPTGEAPSESVISVPVVFENDAQALSSVLDYQPLDWRKPGFGVVPPFTTEEGH